MCNCVTPWTAACQVPHPSLSPRVGSDSCPLSQWHHPTISSCVASFSSHPHSFSASGSFQRVGSSYQLNRLLYLQLQHQFFQWVFRVDFSFTIDWFDILAILGTLKSLYVLYLVINNINFRDPDIGEENSINTCWNVSYDAFKYIQFLYRYCM